MPVSLPSSAQDRLLVFAPHPDDETIATGGLIQGALCAGARVEVLFATDVYGTPNLPVGADLLHAALGPLAREALYVALAGLVRDGVIDTETAVKMGQDVLRGNAMRLYGFGKE